MQKNNSLNNKFNVFDSLLADEGKRKNLRKVLKQHGRTVDDYRKKAEGRKKAI